MDKLDFMDNFEVEMTYRLCSAVPVHFAYYTKETLVSELYRPPLPLSAKQPHIVYMNSNCMPLSGRQKIVDALLKMEGPVRVHSYGS